MTDQDAVPETTTGERDDATVDIFGAAPLVARSEPTSAPYTVLARKYRPQCFEDLVGQEAMVRTLTNAFATGRIAHGFMLTGVRGVGKTTTARLLARALNYETETVHEPRVSDLKVEGRHCRAIVEGRHLDVLELDAASRAGVNDMRELLDGVRYAPAEARYKVYVIDEVHMLSSAAFNALLKTLEEPPPHAKFIFATTEIRKVPVTILSRCQRFDLRRVEPEVLVGNLGAIATAEGVRIDAEALTLIARAAEGSVRDAQSLLDQAMVQAEAGAAVTAAAVRDMLGLADRGQTIELFQTTVRGDAGGAITGFRALFGFGADPVTVVMDLLEHCHGAAIAKALGPAALNLPKDQAARLAALGSELSAGTLSRLWQMLLKAHDEVRRSPHPASAVEMALIRLAFAADLPGPEEALTTLRSGGAPAGGGPAGGGFGVRAGGGGAQTMVAASQAPPLSVADTSPTLQSFDDVVRLIADKRDITLKLDVEAYLRPISLRAGVIEFEPAPGAPANLAHRLSTRLKAWTGQAWLVVAQGGGGAETLLSRQKRALADDHAEALAEPFIQAVLVAFPGAQVTEVRRLAAPEGLAIDEREED